MINILEMISDFSFLKFLGNILYPAMESYPTVPIQSTSRNSMTVQTNPSCGTYFCIITFWTVSLSKAHKAVGCLQIPIQALNRCPHSMLFSTSISSTPAWTSIGSPSQQYGLTETICRGRQINLQWMILRKTICCWQMRSKRKKSRSGKSLLNMILALIPKTTGDSSVNTPMTLLTAVTK